MNKRFVQLGERKGNGHIGKNEQYTVNTFLNKVFNHIQLNEAETVKVNWADRVFNTSKYKHHIDEERKHYYTEGWLDCKRELERGINLLINSDSFGKKKR